MTDPTYPGNIVVNGQRRTNPSNPFPVRGGGAPGGGGGEGGPRVDEPTEEDPTDPGWVAPDPCADPVKRLEWNADAVVAEAAKEFARRAGLRQPSETLNDREWGAYLYRAADGSIQLGPITYGLPFTNGGNGSVTLSYEGLEPTSILGSVHSHSVGNHLPSDGNSANPGDIQHLEGSVAFTGNPSYRLYIVAANLVSAGQAQYNQINVYNNSTARSARDNNVPGPEVNPEAQPCS